MEQDKFDSIQEAAARYGRIERRQKVQIWGFVVFVCFVVYKLFDLSDDMETILKLRDHKADEIFSRFANEKEYRRQQIDSMKRYNDSIKYFRCP